MRPASQERKPSAPMRSYAAAQTSDLLRRVAYQANRTSRLKNADAVHDLRVSIRRLSQCLRVFCQFFPHESGKRIRLKLDRVMDLASEVRNRDIASELLRKAAFPAGSPLVRTLLQERQQAERALVAALKRWNRKDSQRKWRSKLGI